jgi:hypothetical protein
MVLANGDANFGYSWFWLEHRASWTNKFTTFQPKLAPMPKWVLNPMHKHAYHQNMWNKVFYYWARHNIRITPRPTFIAYKVLKNQKSCRLQRMWYLEVPSLELQYYQPSLMFPYFAFPWRFLDDFIVFSTFVSNKSRRKYWCKRKLHHIIQSKK